MKVTVFGSHLCPDALYAIVKLKDLGIGIDFQNISASLPTLKVFLAKRDGNPMFDEARAQGKVGIPLFVLEDGTETMDLDAVIALAKGKKQG